VQQTNVAGRVTFLTIFPGCYPSRWPHIHFEVYPSAGAATAGTGKIATSQIALPQASCTEVYATSGYTESAANLAGMSLASDNVFSDGVANQRGTVTGSLAAGYRVTLTAGISA
jgi:protocatechuate 3,4-dioxygenase beta subunit